MLYKLDSKRNLISAQYRNENFSDAEGEDVIWLASKIVCTPGAGREQMMRECAENYRLVCSRAKLVGFDFDLFPDHVCGLHLLKNSLKRRTAWAYAQHPTLRGRERERWSQGAYRAEIDFDHITPDWERLLRLGWYNIASELRNAGTSEFHEYAALACDSICILLERFSELLQQKGMTELSSMTARLASGAPETLHDALYLIFLTHRILDTEIASICTLGGLDRLLGHYVDADIASGRMTREDVVNLFAEFFIKYDASIRLNPNATASHLGKSCFIGGIDGSEKDVTCETTYIVMDASRLADVLSPKLAIRMSAKTPDALYRRICSFIRDENGHAVLCGDETAVRALIGVGIERSDAYEYAPIGCYEPAVVGREVGCTGATSMNIVKAIELALNAGTDPLTGKKIGADTPDCIDIVSFGDFLAAVKTQISFLANEIMETQRTWERYYPLISPALLMSATMESCVRRGLSAYDGGSVYSNTACNCAGIGSAADSVFMVKRMVFENGEMSLSSLRDIMNTDWEGLEHLRMKIRAERDKWGNASLEVDTLAVEIADYVSTCLNGHPNMRGGVFKSGLYSIDRAYYFGHATGATPDGRKARELISKNLCCTAGMNYNGVTSEISSALKIDYGHFPNGSVLDLMIHPSAVRGEDGLRVLESLIRTYLKGGGFGIQFNIFDAQTLRDAQQYPEKYRNLQIRICGWNAYFVSLTKEQQDVFIREAESSSI